MYKEHPSFVGPSADTIIWRYLTFTKFLSLLDSKALYFCRAGLLGDPYEGSYPKGSLQARDQHFKEMNFSGKLKDDLQAYSQHSRDQMYVNCWHICSYESEAMWKLYAKDEGGVALRTTYKKLKECFEPEVRDVFIGAVKYIDYKETVLRTMIENRDTEELVPGVSWGGGFPSVLLKRLSFAHENELRCIVWKPHIENGKMLLKPQNLEEGLNIAINLQSFIDAIYISPTSRTWFKELVNNVMRRYGYSFDIIQSELAEPPVF